MKKLLCFISALVMVSAVQADTITFSGRDWSTRVGTAGQGGVFVSYAVNDSESATSTGAFQQAAMMYTELSLSVGDVVSYDFTTTKELRNFYGGGDSDWIGDMWSGFIGGTAAQLEDYSYATVYKDLLFPSAALDLSYVWTFTSATTADMQVTDNVAVSTTTTPVSFSDIGDITGFASSSWDTEQDVTVSNFTYAAIPEPATFGMMAVFGGGILFIRRKFQI